MNQKKRIAINIASLLLCVLLLGGLIVSAVLTAGNAAKGAGVTSDAFLKEYTYSNTKGTGGISGIGDPQVFFDEGTNKWYMTGTSDGVSFKLWSSNDLTSWNSGKTIFSKDMVSWGIYDPSIGAYGLWGAEIHNRGGKFYLYFSIWAKDEAGNATSPRIGVATCDTVDGMYRDQGSPLFDYGYSAIDNHLFTDEDCKNYLYYVRDAYDNVVGGVHESHIYVTEMNDSYTSVGGVAEAKLLLVPDLAWEKRSGGGTWAWVEGCWMQKMNGRYYLFYSANRYDSINYAIGYAVSDSPTGPFVKNPDPLLSTAAKELAGPGNNSFFKSRDGKELFTAYHMLTNPDSPSGNRYLNIDRIGLREDGSVYINAPTVTSQPLPSGEKKGHTLLTDSAAISVSSTAEGYFAGSLNDGEVAVLAEQRSREWVSAAGGSGLSEEYVKLDWDRSVAISSVFLYNSIVPKHKSMKVNIAFSDGTMIKNVKLGTFGGEAGIVNISAKKTKWIKITVAEKGFGQTAFALSEIMVFGK